MDGHGALRKQGWVAPLAAYALAVALPCVAIYTTLHVSWLMSVPFVLALLSVATVAAFGRMVPTALVVVLCVLLFNYYLTSPSDHWSLSSRHLAQTATALVVATFIGAVTARLSRTQRELGRREEQHRATLASIGDGVISTNSDGRIGFLNAAAERLTGWTFAEAKGKPLTEVLRIVEESSGQPAEDPVAGVKIAGHAVVFEGHTLLVRKDGVKLNIDDSCAPIFDKTGGLAGMVLVFRDVTAKRRAELKIEEQAAGLIAAQQGGNAAVWTIDMDQRIAHWFDGGQEIFGRPFAEFAGRPNSTISLVWPEDLPKLNAALVRAVESGADFKQEYRVMWPNGEMHWHEARGKQDPGRPHLLRGVTFDITDRKKAEEAILRAEKLSAVGQVASTIAHEINNPLASIVNLLYLALADDSLSQPTRGYLETANQEISRLAGITRLTLSFARDVPGAATADVPESVENVLSLVKGKLQTRNIRVELSSQPGVGAKIKPHELRQVLLNVILNAIDAMRGTDGLLRIAIFSSAEFAHIRIEDNGCGIPPNHLRRIFDPFFSTKPDVGTGVGLWVSRELAQRQGGSISVESGELGDGIRTRFEICLRLHLGAVAPKQLLL